MDPTKNSQLFYALAFLHPALAALALAGALYVLNLGLKMRTARIRRRQAPDRATLRHVRVGPWVAWGIGIGFVLGPVSALALRHWTPFRTTHGWLGTGATFLFLAVALLGRRLRRSESTRRTLHGALGMLAMFVAIVAVLTGIELLP